MTVIPKEHRGLTGSLEVKNAVRDALRAIACDEDQKFVIDAWNMKAEGDAAIAAVKARANASQVLPGLRRPSARGVASFVCLEHELS